LAWLLPGKTSKLQSTVNLFSCSRTTWWTTKEREDLLVRQKFKMIYCNLITYPQTITCQLLTHLLRITQSLKYQIFCKTNYLLRPQMIWLVTLTAVCSNRTLIKPPIWKMRITTLILILSRLCKICNLCKLNKRIKHLRLLPVVPIRFHMLLNKINLIPNNWTIISWNQINKSNNRMKNNQI